VSNKFEPQPIKISDLEQILANGFKLPTIDVPLAIRPFSKRWWDELREELVPLAGKRIDPRFVASIYIE
jgi:hypothetical protein